MVWCHLWITRRTWRRIQLTRMDSRRSDSLLTPTAQISSRMAISSRAAGSRPLQPRVPTERSARRYCLVPYQSPYGKIGGRDTCPASKVGLSSPHLSRWFANRILSCDHRELTDVVVNELGRNECAANCPWQRRSRNRSSAMDADAHHPHRRLAAHRVV